MNLIEKILMLSSAALESLFSHQFHLQSGDRQGTNVQKSWLQATLSGEPIDGMGVLVSIVDDGLDLMTL